MALGAKLREIGASGRCDRPRADVGDGGCDLPGGSRPKRLEPAFLVATVVGSGIMAETLTKDVALALLGNTLPTGAMLVVLITILGPISGAHFNPAVSLVFAIKRELGPRETRSLHASRKSSAASPGPSPRI